MASLDTWLDAAGLMPPLPLEQSQRLFKTLGGDTSGKHVFLPSFITQKTFEEKIFPSLEQELPPELCSFVKERFQQTVTLRKKLADLKAQIENIVGEGNFSALWLDREAFSTDSMEHRALITEAVIHTYSASALQRVVALLYKHEVPMIPYGEGGGYNMGVTPMAPAVTISVRGINHISPVRPSRRDPKKYEVTVGAGVPFKDLQAWLNKRGLTLRCDPNTPRASTGGIVGTGSNGGRKIFEVVLEGRAVAAGGAALRFYTSPQEEKDIDNEPFLVARKFFSIKKGEHTALEKAVTSSLEREVSATISKQCMEVSTSLIGEKASAQMQAQKASAQIVSDVLADETPVPISSFVGAEGCTGFIYETTLEVEKPEDCLVGLRWHFDNVSDAMNVTQKVKRLEKDLQPTYFEIITGHSIKRYLIHDFPATFSEKDEAVIFVGIEAPNPLSLEKVLYEVYKPITDKAEHLTSSFQTEIMQQHVDKKSFDLLIKPREVLPKKLRTKCKTDMEIRTEYMDEVLKIVNSSQPAGGIEQQDVLFGHLTPSRTAIIHWNIGGFDLYSEEQSDIAWDYLEGVIGKAQGLAPEDDPHGSARFTGEHGIAGKAPFLWLNYIKPDDFERMCQVKDALDPKDLFNPQTIFLRTQLSRSLRARLLNVSHEKIERKRELLEKKQTIHEMLKNPEAAEEFVLTEALRCTRCNSCKVCPVIDAEHEIKKEKSTKEPVLPSKRNIIMFLERLIVAKKSSQGKAMEAEVEKVSQQMIAESADLLKKCFFCRKCDKSCPVDIDIHPMVQAYHTIGKLPEKSSLLWKFIYERLLGEDKLKPLWIRILAVFQMLGAPVLNLIRKLPIPSWLKTYTAAPTFSTSHYEPAQEGQKLNQDHNFVVISPDENPQSQLKKKTVYIRYRGCMDTFGNPDATRDVDTFFKETLGETLVDLEKKVCCGFPFEADGLHDRAARSHMISLVEILKCISGVRQEFLKQGKNVDNLEFFVFSNCPTCCEAIRDMDSLLDIPEKYAIATQRAKLVEPIPLKQLHFKVLDTIEVVNTLLEDLKANNPLKYASLPKIRKKVGLKIPCHNTAKATQEQVTFLQHFYEEADTYDKCCGLSGSSRMKHPKIGTKIAEKLFEDIQESNPEVVVSGCPSCRDGVQMQRQIEASEGSANTGYQVSSMFRDIVQASR